MRGAGTVLTDKDVPETNEGPADDVVARQVARLTSGQLECLRLADQHLNSKEIAAKLNISPHTVDQRMRQVLHILGVGRRSEAVRIVAVQRTISAFDTSIVVYSLRGPIRSPRSRGQSSDSARWPRRETGGAGFLTEQRSASFWSSLQLPFATRSNPGMR